VTKNTALASSHGQMVGNMTVTGKMVSKTERDIILIKVGIGEKAIGKVD